MKTNVKQISKYYKTRISPTPSPASHCLLTIELAQSKLAASGGKRKASAAAGLRTRRASMPPMASPSSKRTFASVLVCVFVFFLSAIFCTSPAARAQSASSSPANPTSANPSGAPAAAPQQPASDAPEMNTHETTVPFSVRVNLVPVRVVVRDARGKTVTNLKREDFGISDNRRPQVISHFSVETEATLAKPVAPPDSLAEKAEPAEREKPPSFEAPRRFVALLFDDVHIEQGDLLRSKAAAGRYVESSLQPTDRVALLTISGQGQVDFTDDRARLKEAISLLVQRSVTAGNSTGVGECPAMTYYEADLIQNQHDPNAINVATLDALSCAFNNDRRQTNAALAMAMGMAAQKVSTGEVQTEYSFRCLREIVRRMSFLPGQRAIALVSPGFLISRQEYELSEIIDRAARANVFINTLDARGLYTVDATPDISAPATGSVLAAGYVTGYRTAGLAVQGDVLVSLADGTGGYSFRNSNDLDAGFRIIATVPEASYLLGFTPQNLKFDGQFHNLKISLLTKEKYSILARKGYYAPKKGADASDSAKQDIEEAVFSQEEQHGLPIELHTQYYKVDPADAKLAVLTHLDVGRMQFQKADGRNKSELIIVAVLFDRNGNYITGNQKVLDMRLRDETLQRLNHTGVTVKSSFDVKPGAYVVRLVVRDANTASLSSANGVVDIPH
jgi:VWFA-related protein